MPLDQRPLGDSLATNTSGQIEAGVETGRVRRATVISNRGTGPGEAGEGFRPVPWGPCACVQLLRMFRWPFPLVSLLLNNLYRRSLKPKYLDSDLRSAASEQMFKLSMIQGLGCKMRIEIVLGVIAMTQYVKDPMTARGRV